MKIAMLGTGTWGLALSNLLAHKDHEVRAYSPFKEEIDKLNEKRCHPRFPGITLHPSIVFSSSLKEALDGADLVVYASPSPYIRAMAKSSYPYLSSSIKALVSVSKGLEDKTFLTMSKVIEEETDGRYPLVALSGPTHAEEVIKELPTLCVAASSNMEAARLVRDAFASSWFRVYDHNDIDGVELCGAIKNIMAIASGIAEGLGYGDNARAALISRGLIEMMRLGTALGAKKETFFGLAGLGDLVVTATSRHSRNHECGLYIGQGYTAQEAVKKVGMAVEGLNALEAAYHLEKKLGLELPIIEAVHQVVREGLAPSRAVESLFARPLKTESF